MPSHASEYEDEYDEDVVTLEQMFETLTVNHIEVPENEEALKDAYLKFFRKSREIMHTANHKGSNALFSSLVVSNESEKNMSRIYEDDWGDINVVDSRSLDAPTVTQINRGTTRKEKISIAYAVLNTEQRSVSIVQ